ncbi:YjbH domain-containing protein [Catenovulum maritimum]|uniref:Uncharacterized protein n=1 Tax=Catenovulum maritimum TaxID=1513271 RepID=A0A0J8GRM1_9ALTE|nr:YjbH domain-containing protein [Catenovulum maritimum]KMT63939.1 hypothetical protein XM47_17075 [Catenovulum maritimum]
MNRIPLLPLAIILGISSTNAAHAVDEFINYQGITGAINTPSANTLQTGTFNFLYSKQVERLGKYNDFHSFTFSAGLYDFLEVSGRNATYSKDLGYGSDLSANVKLKMSFIPKDWFSLAIGSQDLGGAANNYGTDYAVLTKSFLQEQLSISAGISHSDSALGRMDGGFASVRYQPTEWLQLQAEYDAVDYNLGVSFATPLDWLNHKAQFNGSILLTSSNDDLTDNLYYGLGFSIPLSSSVTHNLSSVHSEFKEVEQQTVTFSSLAPQAENELFDQLSQAKARLVEFGFEDVSVGYSGNAKLFVSLSNLSTFGRNRLDSLGYVLGLLSDTVSISKLEYNLDFTENGIVTEAYQGTLDNYKAFLQGAANSGVIVHTESLTDKNLVTWVGEKNENSVLFKPRVTLSPDLSTTMGTEFGVFDASVALSTQIQFDLWKGASVNLKQVNQFYETKDFKDGEVYEKYKQASGLSELSLSQTFKLPANIFNMTTLGKFRHDYNFVKNESYWASLDGKHRVEVLLGRYTFGGTAPSIVSCNEFFQFCRDLIEANRIEIPDKNIGIVSYKHYVPKLDLLMRFDAGKYWQADTGFSAELERHFGDTTVRLRYKNTDTADGINNEFIGLSFSVPLTPRKEFNKKYITVRGANKFVYGVTTLIGKDHNRLTPGTADTAYMANQNIANLYFNNHRSGQAYLDRNQDRLKDVYQQYLK